MNSQAVFWSLPNKAATRISVQGLRSIRSPTAQHNIASAVLQATTVLREKRRILMFIVCPSKSEPHSFEFASSKAFSNAPHGRRHVAGYKTLGTVHDARQWAIRFSWVRQFSFLYDRPASIGFQSKISCSFRKVKLTGLLGFKSGLHSFGQLISLLFFYLAKFSCSIL